MAGITQTIPNYTGGISEQPDQLKVPGQVKNVVNAIPDVVHGLYKRPGSKRVGTTPLTNVQSGGSWFHYYRDESEGSYIGQVAADGRVRMWSCNDGTEKNVWYHTDNSAYDGSNSDHTSITTYLSASNTEDVQALTINDTTFLNNRDTTVATTGTTTGRPHTNFAYIELTRTENGRQYSLNIYDSDSTVNISTATRVKIQSDTLAEGSGTGHCPGIGTQVFSGAETNTGSKTNLTFRISALGQQGKHSGSTDNDTAAEDYACSYNREVTLLHGGEGWATNDTTTQTLDQAQIGYSYTVKVTDHEVSAVKANVKAVRPAPTPFDADTAITVDGILGGITGELSGVTVNGNALNYEIIGNGIYLYTAADADDFNVEVVDQDLMRVMQTEINDVTKLPVQCKHGAIVKIANTRMSDEDDYYVKFVGENGKSGPGQWTEVAEPGIVKSLNASTMPHMLQRQADGDFLVKQYTWADREIGDNTTNPIPSFVGQKINRVLFFRNRLVILAGENVVTSRPGSIATPNFWSDTALTVSAVDPIDISCASVYPSDLFDAIEINTGLLCFSTNAQFLLSSDDTVMNPDTAKLRAVSWFNYNKVIPPVSLGQTTGYVDNSNKYSRFMEMANIVREGEPAVVNTSKIVPTLLPKDIDLFTNSRENNFVFFGKTNSDEVIGFRYLNQADKRLQSSWFKWKFNNPIKYHFCVEDCYYLLDTDNFLQKVNMIQADADPSIDQDDTNYLIHLDNYTTVGSGSFSSTTNLTTFTNQSDWIDDVTTPNGTLVVVDTNSSTAREGRYAECTVINSDDFTVPGDWSSATLNIGYLYDYQVDFPRFYLQKASEDAVQSDINSKLTVHRMKLNFGKIGLYETTLTRVGKDAYTEIYESTDLDEYDASDAPYLAEKIKDIPIYERNLNVDVTLKSAHPAPATLRSMSWEGDWSPMHYRRV
tara:strand:- start:646 stop:3456 length:2811 start_codon:yes stop_codon:yes gene_type:complete